MRVKSTLLGIGGALFALPAMAHHGQEPFHLLIDHGLGLGLLAVIGLLGGTALILRRKG